MNKKRKKIQLADDSSSCCGCGACVISCPQKAITMSPDGWGSLYPQINYDFCINCGKCLKACAYKQRTCTGGSVLSVYAAISNNLTDLLFSASGGVFITIANAVLADNGVVYGCSMEKIHSELTPIHVEITNLKDLKKLQGSKYVQSDIKDSFKTVKRNLQDNKTVLFSGTPCQIDALKNYLYNINTDNLFTIDIICHGVPSKQFFSDYIKYIEKKKKIQIKSFSFRDKKKGWGLNAKYEYFKKGKVRSEYLPAGYSSYYSLFLRSETYRSSCYNCKYATCSRVGDITIGDYWGIEKEHPEYLTKNNGKFNLFNGISCVLVNNDKGKELMENYGQGLILESSSLEKIKKWNHQLYTPSKHTQLRDDILSAYISNGYSGVERRFKKALGLPYYLSEMKYHLKSLLEKK